MENLDFSKIERSKVHTRVTNFDVFPEDDTYSEVEEDNTYESIEIDYAEKLRTQRERVPMCSCRWRNWRNATTRRNNNWVKKWTAPMSYFWKSKGWHLMSLTRRSTTNCGKISVSC